MSTNETAVNETEQMELQPVHQVVASESVNIPSDNKEDDGDYFEFEFSGKIVNLKLLSRGNKAKDTTSPDVNWTPNPDSEPLKLPEESTVIPQEISASMEKREKIFNLMPDSTNAWLYIKDDPDAETPKGCCMTDNMANKMIAVIIIILQICAYILMTRYLIGNVEDEFNARVESCYGPNCTQYELSQEICMNLTTGGLMSVLLIGFLWADVVNVLSICVDRINKRHKLHWYGASFLILFELMTAIVCGFLVGLYSENDFDAIGGAVGILFVHDLDEKVFASMQLFRGTSYAVCKKLTAVSLWIVLSVTVAATLACKYEDGSYFNLSGEFQCRDFQYQCSNSECIWAGFQCNGVTDCSDGSDEGDFAGCNYQGGLFNDYCPKDSSPFMCIEDGSCLKESQQCDGILDCPDGSDEGRAQDCQSVIKNRECSPEFNVTTLKINGSLGQTLIKKVWGGKFKCNNGQCIDAQYACDGVAGDCVDGSDEYPFFTAFNGSCPYDTRIQCSSTQVLCKIDGQCILKEQVCDGTKDCADGADEQLCDYECKDEVLAGEEFQCGGKVAFAGTETDLSGTTFGLVYPFFEFDPTDTSTNFSTVSAQNLITYTDADSPNITKLFANATGQCIPIAWRCDGVADCVDGTDEDLCQFEKCSDSEYECSGTGECITKSWLCDGYPDCPSGEDETSEVCSANAVEITYTEITSCGQTESGVLSIDESKYFTFSSSLNGGSTIDFDACGSLTDTVMAIWRETEFLNGNGLDVAYNDDSDRCFSNYLASYLNFTASSDGYSGTYILGISPYSGESGAYQIIVDCS